MTAEKSESGNALTNANISDFNQLLAQFAAGADVVYLNPNDLFDDSTGAMDAQYSGDGRHLLGKYYSVLAAWLVQNA